MLDKSIAEKPLSVVIADDNNLTLDLMGKLVISLGMNPIRVEDEENLFSALEISVPDILIIDRDLPPEGGIPIIQRLRNHLDFKNLYILVLIPQSKLQKRFMDLDAGADDYIPKPLNEREIKAKLSALSRSIRMQNELKYLNEVKDEFLGIAAHDLRNPLTVIMGISELIESDLLGPVTPIIKENASHINKHSKKMLTLINELLDINKINAGKLVLNKKKIDMTRFIEENLDYYKNMGARKKIDLLFDKNCEKAYVNADEARLKQVTDNLISNGFKFSYPETEITVRVESDGDWIHTSVIDQGVGIDESDLSNLFQPFSRAKSRPTANELTTGLGLAIVKKIITMHEGKLFVSSKVGEGSTFTFSLPVYSEI